MSKFSTLTLLLCALVVLADASRLRQLGLHIGHSRVVTDTAHSHITREEYMQHNAKRLRMCSRQLNARPCSHS
jgi:hypothetical protein